MLSLVWMLALVCLALALWCLHICRQQQRRLAKLQDRLREVVLENHALKKTETEKEKNRAGTEERLRSYLQWMDTLINTISNPIYFKNSEGLYQGCNKVFAKQILGLTRDRIIDRGPQDLPESIPPELAQIYQHQEWVMREKGGFHAFEADVQCADGQRRQFLFNLAPIRGENDTRDGCVAVMSDLTDKNRAAQDRLQKEKLQGVLETAGAVCHELNQPLQALSGYIEIMLSKVAGDSQLLGYLERAVQQIERMSDITGKLQGITHYAATDYAGNTRIIDIHKASEIP